MMIRMVPRPPVVARAALAVVVAGLAALVVAGCQPGASPEEPDPSQDSAALRVQVVSGAEGLDESARTEIEGSIGDVLSAYVVEGFLGEFPREGFVRAFESFTSGAARSAARDIDRLTAAAVPDTTDVRATRLDARISLLAPDRSTIGATAAVSFAFEATMPDGTTRPVTLDGRFLLEDDGEGWSVFGYDVTMDDGATVEAESGP